MRAFGGRAATTPVVLPLAMAAFRLWSSRWHRTNLRGPLRLRGTCHAQVEKLPNWGHFQTVCRKELVFESAYTRCANIKAGEKERRAATYGPFKTRHTCRQFSTRQHRFTRAAGRQDDNPTPGSRRANHVGGGASNVDAAGSNFVVAVFTLTHRYNAVCGHRTGCSKSGAEDYLRRKTKTDDNAHNNWNKWYTSDERRRWDQRTYIHMYIYIYQDTCHTSMPNESQQKPKPRRQHSTHKKKTGWNKRCPNRNRTKGREEKKK